MLIGYMRVSKSDGTQTTDLQKDALLKAGVEAEQIFEDLASGKAADRPGLAACLRTLRGPRPKVIKIYAFDFTTNLVVC